ncbi:MAG: tetratricopeptide repeat protein [Chloroflexi bacterium]|nr:tetratricopeptide repeat protein [Chloroflexota bacterium]
MGEISGAKHTGLALVLVLSVALALIFAACDPSSKQPDHAVGLTTDALVNFYQTRLERDPADFISYNGLARVFVRRARETGDVSDYDRAEASLRRSLDILPETRNYQALTQLANVMNARHQFDDGAELGRKAIEQDPNSAQGYAILGDALIALGRYEEARTNYQLAAEIEPGLGSSSRMARLHELDGDLDAAEAMWWSAHRSTFRARAENSAWVHVQLGHLYFNQGDLEGADEQYTRAQSELRDYPHALAGLGRVHAARGQFSDAARDYQRAIDQIPLPEYVIALGDVFSAWQKPDEADQQYALVSAIEQLYLASGINTDLQMAKFAADHGTPADAVVRARTAYEARPDIYASDALAWALYQAEDYEEALNHSLDALRLGTKDALIMFHSGMILHRLGDAERAEEMLSSALELNPGFSPLYGELARTTLDDIRYSTTVSAHGFGR